MKARPLSIAFALLWGGAMLTVGLAHLFRAGYGTEFLAVMGSVYPGFHGSRTAGSVLLGTIYGLADGAVCGWLLGWLYGLSARRQRPSGT